MVWKNILLVAFASCLTWCYIKWKKNREKLENLASSLPGPPALPFIGNAYIFYGSLKDMYKRALSIYDSYEVPFRLWFGHHLVVAITEPEDIQVVLNNSKSLGRSKLIAKPFMKIAGEGLFTAPIEKWKKNRKLITPAFHHVKLLEKFIPIFHRMTLKLVSKLSQHADTEREIDISESVVSNGVETICTTAMGLQLNSKDNSLEEFIQSVSSCCTYCVSRIIKPWLYPDWIYNLYCYFTGKNKCYEKMHIFPMQVLNDKIRNMKKNDESLADNQDNNNVYRDTRGKRMFFLDMLLNVHQSGANFSYQELIDELLTFMIAGSETTSVETCFVLLMLAMHEEAQEMVYQEIKNILSDDERTLNSDDLKKMHFTERCIKETLRLFPGSSLLGREITGDIQLKNVTLRAGCHVAIVPLIVHKNPAFYPEPDVWNPDNFTDENILSRHKYSFLSFSAGPRNCVGKKYAMLSMKVAVFTIISKYRLTTDMKLKDIELTPGLILKNADGYKIRLYTRNTK